jgi:hypothetical protein
VTLKKSLYVLDSNTRGAFLVARGRDLPPEYYQLLEALAGCKPEPLQVREDFSPAAALPPAAANT